MATDCLKNWELGSEKYHRTIYIPEDDAIPINQYKSEMLFRVSAILRRADLARRPQHALTGAAKGFSLETVQLSKPAEH